MSGLSQRKIKRKIARNNARRALGRIRKELRILMANSPKSDDRAGSLQQDVVNRVDLAMAEVAMVFYDINLEKPE